MYVITSSKPQCKFVHLWFCGSEGIDVKAMVMNSSFCLNQHQELVWDIWDIDFTSFFVIEALGLTHFCESKGNRLASDCIVHQMGC